MVRELARLERLRYLEGFRYAIPARLRFPKYVEGVFFLCSDVSDILKVLGEEHGQAQIAQISKKSVRRRCQAQMSRIVHKVW